MALRVIRRHEMSGKHGRKTLKPGEKSGKEARTAGEARNGQAMRKGREYSAAAAPCRAEGAEVPCQSFRTPPVPATDSVWVRVWECPDESVP